MNPPPAQDFCFLKYLYFFQRVFCTEAETYTEYRVDMHGFEDGEQGTGARKHPLQIPQGEDESCLSRLSSLCQRNKPLGLGSCLLLPLPGSYLEEMAPFTHPPSDSKSCV